jgi:hypothetical protein
VSARLPDFLIGGAPRSGTTWLYTALDRHPAIYMAKPVKPEPKFFLVDELYAKGLDHYSRTWFADVPQGRMAGEKSTDYLESPAAAARIARDLPHARLVFILREPVDRAYSNYLWTRMNGFEREDFETALALEAERERSLPDRLKFARPYSYFSRGLYADLLRPYLDRFAADRVLVLKFEDLAERPHALLARLHAFLGVAEQPADAEGLGVINAAERQESDRLPAHVRAALADRYREPNARLASLLGASFEMWPD